MLLTISEQAFITDMFNVAIDSCHIFAFQTFTVGFIMHRTARRYTVKQTEVTEGETTSHNNNSTPHNEIRYRRNYLIA